MPYSIECGFFEEFPIVYVRGEIDVGAVEGLMHACVDHTSGGMRLIMDLLDVDYAEAGPFAAIIAVQRELAMSGGSLAVVCCEPNVERLVRLARFDREVAIFADRDAAARHLRTLGG